MTDAIEISVVDASDEEDLFIPANMSDEDDGLWPTWVYIILFFGPAALTYGVTRYELGFEPLFAAITSLAIMNGSINMVIAWMTISLDGHSNEALEHLETIMEEMDKLEDTLDEANKMVTDFTGDLGEAQELFRRVGVNLTDLDLESIADVVESLKENKDDLNEILGNLRGVDVPMYVQEVKSIDWKALLAGINDVMAFIKTKNEEVGAPRKPIAQAINVMPSFDDDIPDDDELEDFEDFDEDDEYRLMPMPKVEAPQPKLSLKRDKPKSPGLSLKRNR